MILYWGFDMYNQLELNKILGENIKYYRELYNVGKSKNMRITQEKLAEIINVSTSLIGNMESGKTKQGISTYTLYKISSVLNVSIENFFISIENKTASK